MPGGPIRFQRPALTPEPASRHRPSELRRVREGDVSDLTVVPNKSKVGPSLASQSHGGNPPLPGRSNQRVPHRSSAGSGLSPVEPTLYTRRFCFRTSRPLFRDQSSRCSTQYLHSRREQRKDGSAKEGWNRRQGLPRAFLLGPPRLFAGLSCLM